jgi:hypothetical protein
MADSVQRDVSSSIFPFENIVSLPESIVLLAYAGKVTPLSPDHTIQKFLTATSTSGSDVT